MCLDIIYKKIIHYRSHIKNPNPNHNIITEWLTNILNVTNHPITFFFRVAKNAFSEKRDDDLSADASELDDSIGKDGASKMRPTCPTEGGDGQVKHRNNPKKKPPTGNTADNIRVN